MASLQSLPTEILIKIFQDLDDNEEYASLIQKTLLNLTKISKRFNDIISNEKSLMRYFSLNLTPTSFNNEWIGSRKYQKLFITTTSDAQIEDFMEKLKDSSDDIKALIIYRKEFFGTLKAKTAAKILSTCSNVKIIFQFPMIEADDFDGEVPALNLERLDMKANSAGLKILSKTQVESARFCLKDAEGFRDFLANQKSLWDLRINFFSVPPLVVLDDCIDENFSFPLQCLRLYGHPLLIDRAKFCGFLRNHSETLRSIDMETCASLDLLDCFVECENLEKLRIVQENDWERSHWAQPAIVLDSVTELDLTFYQPINFDIAEILPNLRKLSLSNPRDHLVHPIGVLEDLEELFLNRVKIRKIPKTLRALSLLNIKFNEPPKFDENSKIEELTLAKCLNLKWLKNFLRFNKVQLTKIELFDVELRTPEALSLRYHARNFGNVRGNKVKLPEGLERKMSKLFKADIAYIYRNL